MKVLKATDANSEVENGGFAVIDDKGRFSLPKSVRGQLGMNSGSAVGWLVVSGVLVIIPQDVQLMELSNRAHHALIDAGITVESILDQLPNIRARVVEETYGRAFAEELARAQEELVPVVDTGTA